MSEMRKLSRSPLSMPGASSSDRTHSGKRTHSSKRSHSSKRTHSSKRGNAAAAAAVLEARLSLLGIGVRATRSTCA